MEEFDLAVLGGGVAGISAVLRASEMGARACLIEEKGIGGSCFHNGPYPIRTALNLLRDRPGFSSSTAGSDNAESATANLPGLLRQVRDTVDSIACRWRETLAGKGIAVKDGRGSLVGPSGILVRRQDGEELVKAGKVVIATGSAVDPFPSLPFDGRFVFPGDDLFSLSEVPASVLIVGGGKAGCEMAVLFRALGSRVFVADEKNSLANGLDADLATALSAEMKRRKVKLLLGKKIVSVFKDDDKIDVSLEGAIKFPVDKIMLTGRRKANTGELDAERLGIRLGERKEILVDEKMQTAAPGIYAVGSVTGSVPDPNRSEEEGRVAAENALGKERKLNPFNVPLMIYTDPELATVGYRAEDAHYHGFRAVEGRCDYSALDHSLVARESAGLFKVVADKTTKKVIGAHLFAPDASEMIPLAALAVKKGLTANDLAALACGWGSRFQGVKMAARSCVEKLSGGK
ncbi:MAG: NAD(P)/FAD-dependent oxidoreductase [Nitrospinae bacterium]|nr:NAD(P)/FAD-dependent oxidoreductase [Nitrospinota bacterium]